MLTLDLARLQDRCTFVGSITQTLNHILWDDRIWIAHQNCDREKEARISANHPYTDNLKE